MNYISNLPAFCLPLAIFTFWLTLGYAVLNLLYTRRNTIQNILLAPVIGMSVTMLFIFWLNFSGIPVIIFAKGLTAALAAFSCFYLWRLQPVFPLRRYLPFLGILMLALMVTGRPLLVFGFDWVSYSNDDMANYSLAALRFLHHGYSEAPDVNTLLTGRDYSLYFWFLNIANMERPGCELLLAWISGLSGMSPIAIFMPVMMAVYLTLLSSAMAMMYTSRRMRAPTLSLGILLCFSALTTLGVIYQLISQVGGLSLLACAAVIMLQGLVRKQKYSLVKYILLLTILLSSMLLYYPEVFPFLGLAFILYFAVNWCRGWRPDKKFFILLTAAALITCAALGFYTVFAAAFIYFQLGHGTAAANLKAVLFPYYLLPSGLANLWGLIPIGTYPGNTWTSLCIITGGTLYLASIICTLYIIKTRKHFAAAYICLVMIALSFYLFYHNSDFGLFKLAMFIQPFLLATLIAFIYSGHYRRIYQLAVIALLAVIGLPAQSYYIQKSKAVKGSGLSEILYASPTRIYREYANLASRLPDNSLIILNDYNLVLTKFQTLGSTGKMTAFCSFNPYVRKKERISKADVLAVFFPGFYQTAANIINKSEEIYPDRQFDLHIAGQPEAFDSFHDMKLCDIKADNAYLVIDTPMRGIINRSKFPDEVNSNFIVKPAKQVSNILTIISSERGPLYYATNNQSKDKATVFNLETDWFYPETTMQAMGRYLLLQISNPSPDMRLAFSITSSLKGDGKNLLPPADVIGAKRVALPLVGRGSARVFSTLIQPQTIGNKSYLELDANVDGQQFPSHRKWLMNLYGKTIPLDYRRLIGFGRDISVISESEYRDMVSKAPASISRFPADLANPHLEYSGVYEDGWVSEHAYVYLRQPLPKSELVIKGMTGVTENHPKSSRLSVMLDGKVLDEQTLSPGEFSIAIPVSAKKPGRRKIELIFSALEQLPGMDKRPVACRISFMGFQSEG